MKKQQENLKHPKQMQVPVSSQIPRGVGCPPPPGMDPRKGKGKLMCIKVRMLDDSVGVFHLGHKGIGQALFEEVCRHLNLLECDYFGLEFIDSCGNRCWLEKEKSILRQIMAAQSDARFFFIVKFYTPNPAELEEEYTRYLFALQIRRDLARGELICNENTAALLVSYIVQSECGDFSALDYPDHNYLSGTQFVPNQNPAFQQKVMEHHKTLVGMSPAEADFQLLEIARRCDFYGVRLHSARDIYGGELTLSVAHMGIKVFDQLNCAMTFSWAKVRKLSFKRRRLMIKIYPDSIQQFKETIEFVFENRDDCKNFWKKCVEHHSFFRCPEPADPKRDLASSRLFHRGSNFRYQGRTQKQLIDYVREHRKRREPFQRPLRRSGIPFANSALLPTDSQKQQVMPAGPYYQQQQKRAFYVSDRMFGGNEILYLNSQQQQQSAHQINFPPIFCQHQTTNTDGFETNEKARPKSAIINGSGQAQQHPQQRRARLPDNINVPNHHPMQNSCYGAIPPSTREPSTIINYGNGPKGTTNIDGMMMPISDLKTNGNAATIVEAQQTYQQKQQNAFHQQVDPMSMSLPNVLAPSALQTDSGHCFYTTLKSMSGENFHVMEQRRRDMDNQSEGSYQIGRDPSANTVACVAPGGDGADNLLLNSSQSDIGSAITLPAGPIVGVDPRVYQTTFTTKRMGNVIMKKVTATIPTATNIVSTKAPITSSRSNRRQHQSPTSPSFSQAGSGLSSVCSDDPLSQHPRVTEVGGIGIGSSLVSSSHYSMASSSAPVNIRSVTYGNESRIRYAPISGSDRQGISKRLRYEIPVAIDGPQSITSNINSHRHSTDIQPIIRPVLIPSLSGGGESKSIITGTNQHHSSASSANSTPNSNNRSDGCRRPLVMKTPRVGELLKTDGNGKTVTPEIDSIAQLNYPNDTKEQGPDSQILFSQVKNPARNDGPKVGRVIRRQDIVITPNGIELKPLTEKQLSSLTTITCEKQTENQHCGKQHEKDGKQRSENNKPKVPPKPDLQILNSVSKLPVESKNDINISNLDKDDNGQQKQQHDPLFDPLESILADVKAINDVIREIPESNRNEQQKRMVLPAAIAIQSEERPDVRTLHLFSQGNRQQVESEAGIGDVTPTAAVPYTLTVRNLSGQLGRTTGGHAVGNKKSMAKETTQTYSDIDMPSIHNFVEQQAIRHCKSIELVDRRRLPSQDSFSSQDHSISPTSPETGNVLEYVLRKRSQSSERATSMVGQQLQQQQGSSVRSGKSRRADRRLTQPIEFIKAVNNKKNDDEVVQKTVNQVLQMEKNNLEEKRTASTDNSQPKNVNSEEQKHGRSPPENAVNKDIDGTSMIESIGDEKRLLETDF